MIDLQVANTAEDKFALIYQAAAHPELLPPVYVLSHKRAGNLRTFKIMPWLAREATLVVAHSDSAEYTSRWPDTRQLVIPAGYGGHDIGLGRAIQFTLETADLLGQDEILLLNDDLRAISVLYETDPGVVSRAWAEHVDHDREGYLRGALVTMAECAREAFARHPDAVIASPQGNNALRTLAPSTRRWALNTGYHPTQLQYVRVDRLLELTGGINLAEFNYHGEDISLACDIVAAGGQMVNLPTFVGSWLDHETDSVMRSPANAHLLRQAEHDALMRKTELAPYIKTRYDLLDRPQWHALSFTRLKRAGILKSDEALWSDPAGPEGLI